MHQEALPGSGGAAALSFHSFLARPAGATCRASPVGRAWQVGRWLVATAIALAVTPVHASPPPREEVEISPAAEWLGVEPGDRLRDLEPRPVSSTAGAPKPPLWVAIDTAGGRRATGDLGFTALLMVGVPLDRLAARRGLGRAIAEESRPPQGTPKDAPHGAPASGVGPLPTRPANGAARPALPRSPEGKSPAPAPAPSQDAASATAPPAKPAKPLEASPSSGDRPSRIAVTPVVARAAVDAALRHARLFDPDARVDAMASRVRTSAVLPELRLRVSRTVSDGESLSPTAYDPTRTTATDGVSLWLEARAAWRLDRLVFADEEVALERVRGHLVEAQRRLIERVLAQLFAWQRASSSLADPARSPEEQLTAGIAVVEAEVELDLLTDGWFTRWRTDTGRDR